MIIVRRDSKEIFSAGNGSSITFPSGTVIDYIENRGEEVIVALGPSPLASRVVSYAEVMLAEKGHRIQAIKSYRDRTGLGLKESKDAIDAAVPFKQPIDPDRYGVSDSRWN